MMRALGFDPRLVSRETRRWVTVSAAVLSNIALFLAIGWTLDALLRGAAVLTPERIILALALVVLKGVLGWLERFAAVQAAQDAKIAVRETLYEHALRLGPGGLDKERTGELVNTAVDGTDWLEQYFSIYWAQFIIGMLTTVLGPKNRSFDTRCPRTPRTEAYGDAARYSGCGFSVSCIVRMGSEHRRSDREDRAYKRVGKTWRIWTKGCLP